MPATGRFEARFDELAFSDDLAHARLPNCVKTYLPDPGGRWRMVFEITKDNASGALLGT